MAIRGEHGLVIGEPRVSWAPEVVAGAPKYHHNPDQHRQLPLQASRRTHSEDGPHEEAQVEPATVV